MSSIQSQTSKHLSPIERLRVAISTPTMLDILRREWSYLQATGCQLLACQLARLHPRGERGFILDYEMRLSDNGEERIEHVYAELVPEDSEAHFHTVVEKLLKKRRRQLPRDSSTTQLDHLPYPGLILRFPGIDERLHGLKLLYDSRLLVSQFQGLLGTGNVPVPEVENLGHRIGKRCVVRLRFDAPKSSSLLKSVVAKFYPASGIRGARVSEAMSSLWTRGFGHGARIRIPRPIAYLPDWQTLVMEDVSSAPISCLASSAPIAAVSDAGRALLKLHRCPVELPQRHSPHDEQALLQRWVGIVSEVLPERSRRFSAALETVGRELEAQRSFDAALVHRDFYDKQVAVTGHGTFLTDFDTLCYSDPALDVGNFLAHLELSERQGFVSAHPLARAFLDGYEMADGSEFTRRVDVYKRASLLRLACLYAFSERWNHLTRDLLEAV